MVKFIDNNYGSYNGETGSNTTVYYYNISQESFKESLKLISNCAKRKTFKEENLKSEIEIVNSEFMNYYFQPSFIIDNLIFKFIKYPNCYKKFGCGNSESLKNVTINDLMDYYSRTYTSDNIKLCLVDNNTIDYMLNNYLEDFINIEKTVLIDDTITKPILLDNDNIIFYKKHEINNFTVTFLLFIQTDIINNNSIFNFLVHMLSTIFEDSVGSNILLQKDVVNYECVNNKYTYEDMPIIMINVGLSKDNLNTVMICYNIILQFVEYLKNMDEYDFFDIYVNFYKQSFYPLLISDIIIDNDFTSHIVKNMFLLDDSKKIDIFMHDFLVNCCNVNNFTNFKQIITTIKVKIITNCAFENNSDKIVIAPYYNTQFIKTTIDNKKYDTVNYIFNAINLIGIKTFTIVPQKYDDKKISENYSIKKFNYKNKMVLITESIEKTTMIVTQIKFVNMDDKTNFLVAKLYIEIIKSMILYYVNTIKNYNLHISFDYFYNFVKFEFIGLEYLLLDVINNILEKIDIKGEFYNNNLNKYFENVKLKVKNDILRQNDGLELFEVCDGDLHDLIRGKIGVDCQIAFIDNLTIDVFKEKMLLMFDNEVVLISGSNNDIINIFKNGEIIKISDTKQNSSDTQLLKINNFSQGLSINNYVIKTPPNTILTNNENTHNAVIMYALTKAQILNKTTEQEIIKMYNCIDIITRVIEKSFFNQVREHYKIGYVALCSFDIVRIYGENNISFVIKYIVQSLKSPIFVRDCIVDFNKNICNDIDTLIENVFKTIDNKIEYLKDSPFDQTTVQNILIDYIELFDVKNIFVKSDIVRILESIDEEDVRKCLNNLCNVTLKTYSCNQN